MDANAFNRAILRKFYLFSMPNIKKDGFELIGEQYDMNKRNVYCRFLSDKKK